VSGPVDTVRSQPLRALEVANEVRNARAAQKRRLRTVPWPEARRRAAALLADPPAELLSMAVVDWLTAVPGLGLGHVGPALRRRQISEWRTIASLSPPQAEELAAALRVQEHGLR